MRLIDGLCPRFDSRPWNGAPSSIAGRRLLLTKGLLLMLGCSYGAAVTKEYHGPVYTVVVLAARLLVLAVAPLNASCWLEQERARAKHSNNSSHSHHLGHHLTS